MKKRFCAGLAMSLLLLASNWAYATNEVEVYRNGNGSIAVKLFEPSTLNDSPVPFIVRSPEGQFEPKSGRVLISKSHSDGVWTATNINTAYVFTAQSPPLQKGKSSYVVCSGRWKEQNDGIEQAVHNEYTLSTWKAELLEEGIRVFVIYKYNFDKGNYYAAVEMAMEAYVQKMPEGQFDKNIIVTCGLAANIDHIDKLEIYLRNKYSVLKKQVSYLFFRGHGKRHCKNPITNNYQAYSIIVPYLKWSNKKFGFVGDVIDPSKPAEHLCQQSTEDYVKCFSAILKENAIVMLQHCWSGMKYEIDMPILGNASIAKRVKHFLNKHNDKINVIGIKGQAVSKAERGRFFLNHDIPIRPEYAGSYGVGDE